MLGKPTLRPTKHKAKAHLDLTTIDSAAFLGNARIARISKTVEILTHCVMMHCIIIEATKYRGLAVLDVACELDGQGLEACRLPADSTLAR